MKHITNQMRVALAVLGSLVLMAGSSSPAQDLTPSWRGQPGSASAEWRFDSSANPAMPEAGTALATARASIEPGQFGIGWLPQAPGMGTNSGLWDLGSSGTVTLYLNNAGGAALQRISVQVAQWLDGGIYNTMAAVSVPGATPDWGDVGMGTPATTGGWFVDATDWVVPAGATVDRIVISGALRGSVIDQVVVDTLAVVAQPVALSIRPLSGEPSRVEVFWASSTDSFVLESTTDLTDSQSWQPVNAPVEVTGDLHRVPLEASGPARFFRLKQP